MYFCKNMLSMKKIKTFIASALLLGSSFQVANAQDYSSLDYKPYPYVFVTLQGGMQTTFTDYKFGELITPIASASVGGMFSPAIGARINVNGWKSKGGFDNFDQSYEFNYVNSNLDLMVNLTNIIMPKNHLYPVNFYLIGGVGLTYAWDNDNLQNLAVQVPAHNLTYKWDDSRLVHNFRAGMQMEANLTKHISLNLEVTANNMHDRFNSKINGKDDWQLQALAGVTFKFGHKAKEVSSQTSATAQSIYNNNQQADMATANQLVANSKPEKKVEPAPVKPVVETKKEKKVETQPKPKKQEVKKVNIFFELNNTEIKKSEISKLNNIAEWLKANPEAKVEFMGYADAETGTSSYNQRISKKRAEIVVNYLVEKAGISKNRIKYSAKGDTVQPFGENDKNRVVIGIVK